MGMRGKSPNERLDDLEKRMDECERIQTVVIKGFKELEDKSGETILDEGEYRGFKFE